MSDYDCTVACVKMMGQKYAVAAGDKVYLIENQNFAGLACRLKSRAKSAPTENPSP